MTAEPAAQRRRIILAITGASGAPYGVRAAQLLREVTDVETHLIVTAGARATIAYETSHSVAEITSWADVVYNENDLAAAISSGSFRTDGMLIAPCSIKTLSGIANSYDANLVVRAADVMLKERRRLVLMVRETPLHATHLRLMTEVTLAGAIVAPPVPAFYHRPQRIEDIVDQSVGRALDLLGIDIQHVHRWAGGPDGAQRARRASAERGAAAGEQQVPADHDGPTRGEHSPAGE